MARLSREKKQEPRRGADSAAPQTPIEVRVPVPVQGVGGGAGDGQAGASVGGVPVVAADGEEIQQTVLNRLHRIALASGHPVLATIHDDRMGYVIPLRVDLDGSSHLTAEPIPAAPAAPAASAAPAAPSLSRDRHTHLLRPLPGPAVRESAPTFRMRALPEPGHGPEPGGTGTGAPTFPLRAVPESAAAQEPATPGRVAAPTGAFGPPPSMDAGPRSTPAPDLTPDRNPTPDLMPDRNPAPNHTPAPYLDPDPRPTPTPARGFDAVAEAVLGDEPITAPGDDTAPALLAEPMKRINDAVRGGRTEEAARLAEQTVGEASGRLGAEHPEVLRLQELTAYIAYLAGEPVRALRLSLDLAGVHRRLGDAEAAYGNVQSAATAWRAVRDPARGLELGGELIELWTGLAAEGGPAAEEIEQLEPVRTRMARLTQRAQASNS